MLKQKCGDWMGTEAARPNSVHITVTAISQSVISEIALMHRLPTVSAYDVH